VNERNKQEEFIFYILL